MESKITYTGFPIKEAPKDGTLIYVVVDVPEMKDMPTVVWWNGHGWYDQASDEYVHPTEWVYPPMPDKSQPFDFEQYMVTPDRIVILEDGGVALEWQRSGEYIEAEVCPGDETDAPRIEWMRRDKQGSYRHEYKQPGDGREAWRPIESAPRDGTRFLAYEPRDEYQRYECWWHDDFVNWTGWQDAWDSEPHPTHWQPLPEPPAAIAAQRGGSQ